MSVVLVLSALEDYKLLCWETGANRSPLIHDPFSLSEDYFIICFHVIDMAVKQLCREYVVAKGGVD